MSPTSFPSSPERPPGHPEELLAGFVDGTATPEEREAVETHLAACERCRTEVDLAARARAALASLPQLEAPGLAERGLRGLEERALARGESLAPASWPRVAARGSLARLRPRWDRAGWAAALAAAAGLAALFVYLGGVATGPAPTPGAPAGPALEEAGGPPAYDRASLVALADRVAAAEAPPAPLASPAPGQEAPATPRAAETTPRAEEGRAAEDAALSCVREAAGLGGEPQPVHLEEATVEGVPAYVAAFLRPAEAPDRVVVVAVSREGCRELERVERPA
jgi:hypothetical protein